jgi:hypothetical protein
MPAIGDILRVVQHFSQGSREAVLVNFYEIVDDFGAFVTFEQYAEAYHDLFGSTIVPYFLHTSAKYYRTVLDDLTDGLAFGDFSDDIAGSVTGDACPSFVALSVKQNVGSRLTRNGFKRLPFVSELTITGNSFSLSGTALTNIEGWYGEAITLENPIGGADFLTIKPVIIGRVEVLLPEPHYELDLSIVNDVTTAFVQRATSQNSRKS